MLSTLLGIPIPTDISIKRVVDDSRQITAGDVLVFDNNAIGKRTANAIVADALTRSPAAIVANVQMDGVIFHPAPWQVLTRWAKQQYPTQPTCLVGVTGTNGKTSVAWFYHLLASVMVKKAASIGTLGVYMNGEKTRDTGYTSPTALVLHDILHTLSTQHITHACMEVSSHALALHRADGAVFKAVGFTNITQDHLDFHHTMEAYAAAKLRLVAELLPDHGTAVVNILRPELWPAAAIAKQRSVNLITVGTHNAELVVQPTELRADGMVVQVKYGTASTTHTLPLVGDFQAENVATTLGLLVGSGFAWGDITNALNHISAVPGRMEIVPKNKPTQPTVVVDYAHTPDALERALKALRPFTKGKLWVVFGCGGDRDATKRPKMGAIAAKLADEIIITDDNPRTENAADIRAQIAAAAPHANVVNGRENAIEQAINHATGNDVVLLAGKGHESGQIIGRETHPFDDRLVARNCLTNPSS